jgi:hypothetical protein
MNEECLNFQWTWEEEECFEKEFQRFRPLVLKYFKARNVLMDTDDAIQEARIAFFIAKRTWNPAQSKFTTYYRLLMKRRLMNTARQLAQVKRNATHNISFNYFLEEDNEISECGGLENTIEEQMLLEEKMKKAVTILSKSENRFLSNYLESIAVPENSFMCKEERKDYQTLYRVKKKFREFFYEC